MSKEINLLIEDTLADLALADCDWQGAVEHSWHAWRLSGSEVSGPGWDRLCAARDLRDLAADLAGGEL